ncbi:MAG: flagellar hook-associated protein 3, partial [Tissierellia bacterium]|nr:flagellar hook-associated protein 3 [Tissierellia bacterium]
DMSMSGIKFIGYGKDSKGMSNNLYTLIGEIKKELRSPEFSIENITPYIERFEEQKKQVLVSITDIGSKTNYLDFLKIRNEDNQFNLNEKLLEVEYVDPAEAIVDFNMQRYSYNAALSMGNKILENSFIDFMK